MNEMGGVADERDALGDERTRDEETERVDAPRADRRDLAEMQLETLLELGMEASSGNATMRSASSVVSVHTIDERCPLSGRIANGPAGRKCSSARPP
jgi:hypothetical protein